MGIPPLMPETGFARHPESFRWEHRSQRTAPGCRERPADPTAEQCGWRKDRYGLSWQVWPRAMGEMMEKGTPEQVARVTKAMLTMKKFDIAAREKVFEG